MDSLGLNLGYLLVQLFNLMLVGGWLILAVVALLQLRRRDLPETARAIWAVLILRRAIDDLVYDNRNHYLPCEKLPAEPEVRSVVAEHADLIQRIEQIDPGQVVVRVDTTSCPGKADLLISYPSHQNRLEIEAIIAGDTFYGVPYRLRNW